ncbi:MAG: DUF2087 domain-containing protein [Oscillospiraceae bacterium]|nr:DUF2087 domain-containing protein [Oscillospiraceae bacterium]
MLDRLEQLTAEELKRGYVYQREGAYRCLICGRMFEEGEVFPIDGHYYEPAKAVQIHMTKEHPNRLDDLLRGESKYLSLTENQSELLRSVAAGQTDAQIAAKTGTAVSTVRHQRFVLREKAKRAKLYLAVYEMVQETQDAREKLIQIHGGAKMIDDRYSITEEEQKKILANVFISLEPLKLKVLSSKEKKKIVILSKIAEQFEPDRVYSGKETDALLKEIFDDYASLRRHLIEYGFLDRTTDGNQYWKRK